MTASAFQFVKNSCQQALLSPLTKAQWGKATKPALQVLIFGKSQGLSKAWLDKIYDWQKEELKKNQSPVVHLTTEQGVIWVLRPYLQTLQSSPQQGSLEEVSVYAQYRNSVGEWSKSHLSAKPLQIEFLGCTSEQRLGALVGLGLGYYKYKNSLHKTLPPKLYLQHKKSASLNKDLTKAQALVESINLARHLVNLPPQDLNPKSFSELAKHWFKDSTNLKVEVWPAERLKKEAMGLHLGVGQGAEHGPCLVRIKYRPRSTQKPVALVGKGITFDTGGLDLKPSPNMRLMKKDMGGAATVFALAHFVSRMKSNKPCDFYLPLAENSVSDKAYRPSDVLTARNGLTVEIDNTDAEGRLVLADALHVAATQKGKDEPQLIIDLATLTGSAKIALGNDVGALFSNKNQWSLKIENLGQKWGDPVWRLPLYQPYFSELKTSFADFKNCGSRWGGSITAALFLQQFIEDKPWVHLDILAWQKGRGPFKEEGGSGQAVQALMDLIS